MNAGTQDIFTTILQIATFVFILCVWIGFMLLWLARHKVKDKRIESHLGLDGDDNGEAHVLNLWHQGENVSTTITIPRHKRRMMDNLNHGIRQAGWKMSARTLIVLLVGLAVILVPTVGILTGDMLLGVGTVIALFFVFRIYMASRIARSEALFETQLVDAMELAARSLRAGHPLLGAFQLISEELTPPVSTVFGELCQRHEMGESLSSCLQETAEAPVSLDMKMFATSIAIQMKTGGNLADLMERLATVIRERMRLNRKVRVLTAQTQMSKRILVVLPFFIFFMLNFLNPGYMNPLYTTDVGHILLVICVVGLTIGIWSINKMAVLRY